MRFHLFASDDAAIRGVLFAGWHGDTPVLRAIAVSGELEFHVTWAAPADAKSLERAREALATDPGRYADLVLQLWRDTVAPGDTGKIEVSEEL